MKNKFIALLLTACTVPAFAGTSGYLGYTSDYMYRGLSQSNGQGALQASLKYETEGGLYGGIWASEVDFGNEATYELDFYGGYVMKLSDKLSVDVGVKQINWDKGYDDVEEAFVKVNLKGVSFAYNVVMGNSDQKYMQVGYTLPFIDWADVSLMYGRFDENNDFGMVTVGKMLNDNIWLRLEVMDDARQGQFMDMSNLGMYYHF